MRLGERLVERQRTLGRLACAVDAAHALHGRVARAHQGVAVGQSRVGRGEIGIVGNRALEKVGGLLQRIL